jgi:hypothetical protein
MSLLLLFRHPSSPFGPATYLPNGLALTAAVNSLAQSWFVSGGATSTAKVKSGQTSTVAIDDGSRGAAVL